MCYRMEIIFSLTIQNFQGISPLFLACVNAADTEKFDVGLCS